MSKTQTGNLAEEINTGKSAGQTGQPTLSIVIPMYNEEEVLPLLLERLGKVLDGLGESYEILCVNDGSRDGTAEALAAAHRSDHRIKALNLSRNFGKEIALTAGLDHAKGRAVVPLDADLQDPPELIGEFLKHWRDGYDVVCGVRRERKNDTWLKRQSATAFYRIINRLAGIKIPKNTGDFRLMDRRVVDALKNVRERNRFMKGLFAWVGFRQTSVFYDRPERAAGTTKFSYWKLWNFAVDGITGYSTLPLRLAGYLGVITALLSLLYGFWLVVRTMLWGRDVPGYASVMVAVLFMGGVQLIVLGVIGEYIGRVFQETKHRPLYVLDSAIGFEVEEDSDAAAHSRAGN